MGDRKNWVNAKFHRYECRKNTGGAGYKTLLLAVYKTSLFFGGSEVAAYFFTYFRIYLQKIIKTMLVHSEYTRLSR